MIKRVSNRGSGAWENKAVVHMSVGQDASSHCSFTPVFTNFDLDIHNIDDYMPISVLCSLSKIIQRVTFSHIYSFLIKEGLLHKFQSGFRHLHSATKALLHLINTTITYMDNILLTGALFLDLRKAFDTVNHIIMLAKLKV